MTTSMADADELRALELAALELLVVVRYGLRLAASSSSEPTSGRPWRMFQSEVRRASRR